MELYILSRQDLSILSVSKVSNYEINLDEETNAKSVFTLINAQGLEKDNFIVLNGLYRQFLFIIDEVQTEKGSNVSTVTALDISNLFDRKVIEKNTDIMTSNSIEQFIANTMAENFVNSDDTFLNVGYIDIYWHTNTQGVVATNTENGLYNFHTFLTNCRQYKNIYTEFQFVNGRLRIDITYKTETTQLIDTTLPEVTNYNKIHEDDITAKVTVLIREDNSEYNLYLKTDHTTTTNKNNPNRASGKIEVISVDTADMAETEALNVMKGNSYKHLVEFKIAKTSKTMDITQLYIGRLVRIKTKDDIYDSYISAITLSDENFVYFKSGSLRETLLDKLKVNKQSVGNKLDKTGGIIQGDLNVRGSINGKNITNALIDGKFFTGNCNDITETGVVYVSNGSNCPPQLNGVEYGFLFTKYITDAYIEQEFADPNSNNRYTRSKVNGTWLSWERILTPKHYFGTNPELNKPISSGSWQDIFTNAATISLEQGKYKLLMSVALSPQTNLSNTGIATIRPIVDGNELGSAYRSTVPVLGYFLSSTQVEAYFNATSGNHTFNGQIYSTEAVIVHTLYINIERVG